MFKYHSRPTINNHYRNHKDRADVGDAAGASRATVAQQSRRSRATVAPRRRPARSHRPQTIQCPIIKALNKIYKLRYNRMTPNNHTLQINYETNITSENNRYYIKIAAQLKQYTL